MKKLAQTFVMLLLLPGFVLGAAIHGAAEGMQQAAMILFGVWDKKDERKK